MSNQPALPLAQPGQQPAPRTAPHNLEAEQALLGAILFDNETMNRINSLLKEQHFYDPVHGRIFATCQDMIAAGQLAELAAALKGDWTCQKEGLRLDLAFGWDGSGNFVVTWASNAQDGEK